MKIIGIDPDIDKPGVCELDESGAIVSLESIPISILLSKLASGEIDKDCIIAIEDLSKKKATYFKRGVANHRANTRVSNSIGMVQGAQRVIRSLAVQCGYTVVDVPDGVGKQVKKNAKLFKQLSGYDGRTNEDKRDAWAIAVWAQNILKIRDL